MKHYDEGKPYPAKKGDKGKHVYRDPSSGAKYAGRKNKSGGLRIFLVLSIALAVLALAGLALGGQGGGEPVEIPPAPAPTATPTPTAAPTPTNTPTPTPEPFTPPWDTTGEDGFPYLLAVNRTTQTITVYEKDSQGNYTVPYTSFICSTGRDTPEGFFHTTDQYTWRALVGGVHGQYATRITTDILFHSVPYYAQDKAQLESEEYNKLGTPASLGCVRMRVIDCKWIYEECPSGTPTVIFDGDESLDPLGNPGFEPIDLESPHAGWDPTDPDPANPWHSGQGA